MDPAPAALREHFGFDRLPPRPGGGGGGRARPGATCSSSCRRAPGKSLCYQLPGADARRPDDRRLAARVADAGPGRGARARGAPGAVGARQRPAGRRRRTARRSSARAAGELRLLYVAPERFASPGFLEALRDVESASSSSTRRTASRSGGTTSGPTTSASPTPRAGSARGRSSPRRRPRRRRSPRTSRARLGLRDPVRVDDRLRPPEPVVRASCRAAARPTSARGSPRRSPSPGARRRSSTRARARGTEQLAADLGAALGRRGRRLPRGPAARERARSPSDGSWRARSRSSSRRTRSGWASTRPTCAPSRTRACPGSLEAYYQEAGRAGRDGAPARALLFAEARDKGLHVFFIERAEVDDAALADSRRVSAPPSGRCRSATRAARSTSASRELGDDPERVARDRRPPRARRRACAPRRRRWTALRGRLEAPFDGRARAACRASAGEAHARALAPVPLDLGVRRGRRAAGARRSCATSATARAPAPTVPCCDVCAPERRLRRRRRRARRAGAGGGGAGGGVRRPGRAGRPAPGDARRGDPRRRRRRPSPRSAARAPSRSCAAAARRSSRSTATTGCPPTARSRTCPRRRGARARRRADRRRAPALDRRPRTRSSRVAGGARGVRVGVLASGRGHEPPGAARHRPRRARSRSSPSPPTSRARGRSSARRAAGVATRGLRARRVRGPRRRGTRRSPTGSRRATSSSSSSPATWRSSTTPSSPASPGAIVNVHPVAAARLPRRAGDRAGARLRREGLRRHRPPRRRGRGHRAGDPVSARSRCPARPTPADVHAALRPLEHALLPRGGRADRARARCAATRTTRGGCSSARRVGPSGRSSSSSSASGSSNPSGSPSPSSASSAASSSSLSNASVPSLRVGPPSSTRRSRRRARRSALRARRRCVPVVVGVGRALFHRMPPWPRVSP